MKILSILIFLLIPSWSAASIEVFVSVLPQKLFVERVGGEHVRVRALVNKGFNPATYQPTTRQIGQLADADLYVRTGMPFEESWMSRIRAANPRMQVLDMRDGMALLPLEHAHKGHDNGHDLDPHVWTDPMLVKAHLIRLRKELSVIRPDLAEEFAANQKAFAAELELLDQDIRQLLQARAGDVFFVFHPAWGYFARRYDLQQVAADQEGKEPSARQLALIIEQANAAGVAVVFVQPQFSLKAAQVLAAAINARVEQADPLDEDYFSGMREFAAKLAAGGR